MYDIDLIWHTHQLSPKSYHDDMKAILGYVMTHDDSDQSRKADSKLSISHNQTQACWQQEFNEPYHVPGVCYRGFHPRSVFQPVDATKLKQYCSNDFQVAVQNLQLRNYTPPEGKQIVTV